MVCSAQSPTPAPEKGPAEVSGVTGSSSTPRRLEVRKNRLQELEDSLTRALQPFISKPSLEPEMPPPVAPPMAPAMQNTRVKDMLDRRKNWMLQEPDDMILGKNGDNPLQIPDDMLDSRERKGGSAQDPLSKRLNRDLLGNKKDPLALDDDPMGVKKPAKVRGSQPDSDDGDLPNGIRERVQSLRKMVGSGASAGAPALGGGGSFSDFFGLGMQSKSVADEAAHKAYMEQYKQILAGGSSPGSGSLASAALSGQPAGGGGLDALANSRRMAADASTPEGLNSLLNPGALLDANAKVLNQWNPYYDPPKPEAPKPYSPTVPMVTTPRRKFQ